MLKEFIQHIQETTRPQIVSLEGATFAVSANGTYSEICTGLDLPDTLTLQSLDALVKLVRTEGVGAESLLYITVPDHMTVRCFGKFQEDARCTRTVYYEVKATDVPGFNDGFREQDRAIIELRSKFAPGEGVDYLLDLLSRISKESNVTSKDNGVSQSVEARQGIALKENVPVKPRVPLRPFRTFQEVEQPESEFLLRLNEEVSDCLRPTAACGS